MNRVVYVCLIALALTGWQRLHAQSLQASLEVNLGPISIDSYDGTSTNGSGGVASGPNIPACSFTAPQSNYRTCMQFVLADYAHQGVVGVRFTAH